MIDTLRLNNFDNLRLLAAASVVFSHAFLIADGHELNEPFVRSTGHILGIHGVFVFLIISGFLVTRSLVASSSLRSFAWKRVLRIYPALFVCAVTSAFLFAPFFCAISAREYFTSLSGMKYVAKVLLLYDVYEIPSVQFYDQEVDRLGYSVNGSLWTIASEIYCYILLFVLAALELIYLPVALFALLSGCGLLAISLVFKLPLSDVSTNLIYTVPSFSAGVAMHLIHTKYGLSKGIAIGSLIVLLFIIPTGQLMVLFPIFAAYPVIYFGISQVNPLANATRFGDLSYGTYLYGWPLTQIVRSLVGTSLSGWGLFFISFPAAAAFGWLSWHLIEKRALSFKAVLNDPRPNANRPTQRSSH
jgi:peptidoglycan/LPS O-acetylase OafA/YrhL